MPRRPDLFWPFFIWLNLAMLLFNLWACGRSHA